MFRGRRYDTEKIEKPDTSLTEEEYEAELTRVLDAHATVETVEEDRPLVAGDWADIEFKGQVKDLAETVTEEVDNASASEPSEPILGEDVLVEVGGAEIEVVLHQADFFDELRRQQAVTDFEAGGEGLAERLEQRNVL